jgi:hypothetical protein
MFVFIIVIGAGGYSAEEQSHQATSLICNNDNLIADHLTEMEVGYAQTVSISSRKARGAEPWQNNDSQRMPLIAQKVSTPRVYYLISVT